MDERGLTERLFRRTLRKCQQASTKHSGGSKSWLPTFRSNEKFYLSPGYQEQTTRSGFPKGTIRNKIHSRSNGRHIFKTETVATDGCHSVKRQQGHRIETGVNPSRKRHHWLAQASSIAGKAGFCFSQIPPRRVCGWLLLARLPVALPDAPRQPAILAKQDFTKCRAGSRHNSAIETRWLAGASPLGAFADELGYYRAQNQIRIEHWKPMMQDWHADL